MKIDKNKWLCFSILVFVITIIFSVSNQIYGKSITQEGIDAFPLSYRGYLRELSVKHPNWRFIAVKTNVDWNTAIANESVDRRSLIPINYSSEWKESDVQIEPGWVNASDSAIGYAMDPRNFLTEEKIFQFETTRYNDNVHVESVVDKVLQGTPMGDITLKTKYQKDISGNWVDMGRTYANIITQMGAKNNVSPVHLASRIRQENAGNIINNKCINGIYPGYEGLYNFFNISATTADGLPTYVNALKRARLENWTDPCLAIDGGAYKIYNSYTKYGQDTVYFEKWDVNDATGGQTLFWHQYMSNILAPSSESSNIYSAYSKSNILNNSFIFYIPYFENMPLDPVSVGQKETWEEDHTKVYLDDTSDTGVKDTFLIRSGPSSEYPIVATIEETKEGQDNRSVMTRIKKGLNIPWDKVRLKSGVEGYVYSEYVKIYQYIKVTNLTLDKSNLILNSGEKEKISVTIEPSSAKFKEVNYYSADETIAIVDKDGNITARCVGQTTIYAESDDQPNIKAICNVTVNYNASKIGKVGEAFLTSDYISAGASYFTNNEQIIDINKNTGKFTIRFVGAASIFALDNEGNIIAMLYVEGIHTTSIDAKVGEKLQVKDIISGGVRYSTNNQEIVEIDEKTGEFTSRYVGDATIFVEDQSGKMIALILVKGVHTTKVNAKVGEKLQAKDVISGGVRYYTNNQDIIEINEKTGEFISRYVGDATIFVEDSKGKIIALILVEGIHTTSIDAKVGEKLQAKDVISGGVRYYTNNQDIIEINEKTGEFTSRYVGDATIFVKNDDNKMIGLILVQGVHTLAKNISVGDSVYLPSIAPNGYTFYTNNEKIIDLNKEQKTAKIRYIGNATIFVQDSSGKMVALILIHGGYTKGITINEGESYDVSSLISNGKYYYTNNDKVLSVDPLTGKAKMLKKSGIATIFVENSIGKLEGLIYVEEGKKYFTEIKVGQKSNISDIIPGKYYYSDISQQLEINSTTGEIVSKYIGDYNIFVEDQSGNLIGSIFVKSQYTISKDVKVGDKLDVSSLIPHGKKYYTNNTQIIDIDSKTGIANVTFIGAASIFVENEKGIIIGMIYINSTHSLIKEMKKNDVIEISQIIPNGSFYYTNNDTVLKINNSTGNVECISVVDDATVFVENKLGKVIGMVYIKTNK